MTSVIQTCQKAFTSAAPRALGAAIAHSSTDSRVKSVSLGLGCVGTGFSLLRQSGAAQSLKGWIWKEEAPSCNWSLAGAGALLMIYGSFQVAIGFASPVASESMQTNQHIPSGIQSDTCPIPQPFQKEVCPIEECTEPDSCEKALEQAQTVFLRCPDARKLWGRRGI